MTKYAISTTASIDGKGHTAVQITGLIAGEDLAPCTPVTIKAVGGKFRVMAAVAGETFDGINPMRALAGEPVTVMGTGVRFHASDAAALVPGVYGLSNTKGSVDSAATTPVFRAVSATDLQVIALGKTSA